MARMSGWLVSSSATETDSIWNAVTTMASDTGEQAGVAVGQGANRLVGIGVRGEPGERAIDALGDVHDAKQALEQRQLGRRVHGTRRAHRYCPHGPLRS